MNEQNAAHSRWPMAAAGRLATRPRARLRDGGRRRRLAIARAGGGPALATRGAGAGAEHAA